MEYILKNKKKDMYVGTNNKFVKEKTQAVILDRKGVSEKLKTVQNPDEWELMVIHDKDKLTEDDKIRRLFVMVPFFIMPNRNLTFRIAKRIMAGEFRRIQVKSG